MDLTNKNISLYSRDVRRAMGVECSASISGPDSPVLVQRCLDLVEELEQLWSRFIPSSDICKLNNALGKPVFVDPRTIQLVQHMVSAHASTQGAFNPTLLPLQIAAGDNNSLEDSKVSTVPQGAYFWSELSDIRVHEDGRMSLPQNMTLDAGGIGKGFAADLVREQAVAWGAEDVCINLGGDLSCSTQSENGWNIDILSPQDRSVICTVAVRNGGVATSAVNARHRNGSNVTSHIFSSQNNEATALGASVIANTAAWAEAWTKFAILTPTNHAKQELEALGLAALIVDANATVHTTSTWKEFIQ